MRSRRAQIGWVCSALLPVILSSVRLQAEEPAGSPHHETPQAAFEAFREAALKNDWQTALRSCATRLQDHLLMSNVRLGYHIALNVPEHLPGFEAILRRHVPQLDAWKRQLKDVAAAEHRQPETIELAAKIRDGGVDKPALLADLFDWITKRGIDHGLPADGVIYGEMRIVAMDGAKAKAIAVTGDEDGIVEFPFELVREADGWRVMLPEL